MAKKESKGYEEKTKKKVMDFIRKKKRTHFNELQALGKKNSKKKYISHINTDTLNNILKELEKNRIIKITKIAKIKLIELRRG